MLGNVELKELEEKYGKNMNMVNNRVRVLSSQKCLLNNRKGIMSENEFTKKMDIILREWELLREYKELINGKKTISYEDMKIEDIEKLSYEELERGLRGLSSIKSRCKVERIESIERKYEEFKKVKEDKKVDNKGYIYKSDVVKMIEVVKNMGKKVDREEIIELMEKLL